VIFCALRFNPRSVSMSSEHLIYSPLPLSRGVITVSGIDVFQSPSAQRGDGYNDSCACMSLCLTTPTPKQRTQIFFYEILWCQWSNSYTDSQAQGIVDLAYIKESSGSGRASAKPQSITLQLQIEAASAALQVDLCHTILSKAYENSRPKQSILILINPHGGQGNALDIYKSRILPILKAAHVTIHYEETRYHQHAVEIARQLDITKYDVIACCLGDGIPHQVINGFYQRPDRGALAFEAIAITQLPCGSGNALALSTHGSNDAAMATLSMLKAKRTKLDLMAVTQKDTTSLSFLTQCFGMIADADIGTEHLRWMGSIRFEIGVVQKVFSRTSYPCDVYVEYVVDDKKDMEAHFNHFRSPPTTKVEDKVANLKEILQRQGPSLAEDPPKHWTKIPSQVTDNLNILYVGKMPYISNDTQFFPAALPNDATMDLVISDTNSSVWETTKTLLCIDKGLHVHKDKIIHAKIKSYRLVPKLHNPKGHHISVDGESFPVDTMQTILLPGVMTSLLPAGEFVATSFSK
jgi:sphingosine kinase